MLKITKLYKSLLNFFIILITLLINSNLCALCNELSSNNDIVIRVGVLENTPTFSVSCPNGLSILDASNKKIESTKNYIEISCFKNEIYFEKHILTPPIKIESLNGVISVNYKPYRGYLIVKKSKDKMNVINVLHIEDYLKGVLPNEIGHKWNTEALKTQAVVSRTYAIKNLNKHDNNCNKDNSQGFDVCSTTHCQIYNGIKNEANTCNNAILETQAEVLTYNKNLAQTVFHSSCGGHTENPKYVWNFESITPNYLKGVKCNYCSNNTNYVEWKSSIDEAVIRKKLLNNKNITIR
ncbi:MAG: SpoIID/LytB domain-containing protein [Endomicrobium sp.]|jgi:stage II sporulation protein D|nr:SpoIID/LytB domain-containing protein [Endomicrobium sp.]